MSRALALIIIVAAVCIGGGCVPEHYTIRPGATGKVLDSANGVPVSGAKVTVEGPLTWAGGTNYVANKRTGHIQAQTDDNGKFSIDALTAIRPHSAMNPKEPQPITGQVTIEKYGYKTSKTMFTTDSVIELGTIALQRR